jgi:outer membrane protein assembly factor BamA
VLFWICGMIWTLSPLRVVAAPPPTSSELAPPALESTDDPDPQGGETLEEQSTAGPSDDPGAAGDPEPLGPPTDPPLPGLAGRCGLTDSVDPLVLVAKAIEAARPGGIRDSACGIESRAFEGRSLHATLRGDGHALLIDLLGQLAVDGYAIELLPRSPDHLELVARVSRDQRGVEFVQIRKVHVQGEFLPGDDAERIRRVASIRDENFDPSDLEFELARLGYRVHFEPVTSGEVRASIRPGRAIRRVRVHGEWTLRERDVVRALSIDARPGALARGDCVAPAELRDRSARPPVCDARDFACRQWERTEIERIERFLFESGYLRGTAALGLSCGRDLAEADLHVYLRRGATYKIDPDAVEVRGATAGVDEAWIKRRFVPRTLVFFRDPVSRAAMEEAREDVETLYAEPGASLGKLWRRADAGHPEVQVRTSYEQLDPLRVPDETDLPLEIRVSKGRPVQARFSLAPGARSRGERRLSYSHGQLQSQLQLFARRDGPSRGTIDREAANIRAFYQRKGYPLAAVEGSLVDFGEIHELRIAIEEGPKARIRSLELERPRGVGVTDLASVDRVWREERRLTRGGKFSEANALEDLRVILGAYTELGHVCAGAQVRVAFWPEGLDREGEYAVLDPTALIENRRAPAWLSQLDARGIQTLLEQDRLDVYLRIEVFPGPIVETSRTQSIEYLEDRIPPTRRVEGTSLLDPESANWSLEEVVRETPLRAGNGANPWRVPVTLTLDDEARDSIVRRYRDAGFPVADAELDWRYERHDGSVVTAPDVKSLLAAEVGVCQENFNVPAVRVQPHLSVYEGRRGVHGETLIRGNFKTQKRVLERELELEPGDWYSEDEIRRSVTNIEGLGQTRQVRITPRPVDCDYGEAGQCRVHHVVTIEESKDYALDVPFGVGSATLNPLYVFANPTFPNMNGSAWTLVMEGRYGFDLDRLAELEFCGDQKCFERNVRGSLLRPHLFGSKLDFDLTGRFQQRHTPARGRIDTAYGSVRLTWRFREGMSLYGGYLIQLANISEDLVKPVGGGLTPWVNRPQAVVSNRTGLLETGAVFTQVDNAFNPSDGFIAAVDLKLASPALGGQEAWFRADLSWQQFIPIPLTRERLGFRYSVLFGNSVPFASLGEDTATIPDVWRYYGGGTAQLGLRGILPETMLVDVEPIALPFGGVAYRPRAQGGQIRALGTVALQVVSIKDFIGGKLAHSLFYDFGFLTQFWRQLNLREDYRHSVGINAIKWDVQLVTLALGYAILLPPNVGITDDRNGRFVFDVGITF